VSMEQIMIVLLPVVPVLIINQILLVNPMYMHPAMKEHICRCNCHLGSV
jgi:hypothetical protein